MKKISPIEALAAALLIAVLLVGAGSILASCGSEPTTGTSPATGTSLGSGSGDPGAPQFSGVTLDGDIVTLDQFRGKPLLLVYMTSG